MIKLIRRFSAQASLGTKILVTILSALILSVSVFFLAYGMGEYLVDTIYMSASSVSARKAEIYTDFATYVRDNNVTGTDTAAVAKWTVERDYVTIIVIGNDSRFSARGGRPTEVTEQTGELVRIAGLYGKLFPLRFADGMYQIAIGDNSQEREKNVMLVAALILAALTFIGVMLLYTHSITKRIIALSREATVIGQGDLEAPITRRGEDEISMLAGEMDDMRRSVIERMSNERRAWEANSELITAISHDIRTPMTGLLGYLGLLASGRELDREQREQFTASAYGKAMELKDLTDELFKYFLVFGRAELELQRETVDGRLLLEQLLGEAQFDLTDSGFTVEREDFSGECTVNTDTLYLKRVIDNLVSNLKKYADKAGTVTIRSLLEADRLTVSVSNLTRKGAPRAESTRIGLRTCEKIMGELEGSFSSGSRDGVFTASLSLPAVLAESVCHEDPSVV